MGESPLEKGPQEAAKSQLIEDEAKAEKLAYEVETMAGRELEEKWNQIKAMSKFPGLEEQVKKAQKELKRLIENTEVNLEGKKWAPMMIAAFEKLEKEETSFLIHDYLSPDNAKRLPEFVRFIVHKFGPKLGYFEPPVLRTEYYYLPIPGTSYVFQLEGDEEHPSRLWLKKVKPDFLEWLREPKPPQK